MPDELAAESAESAESILTALADPLGWRLDQDEDNDPDREYWAGQYQDTEYFLSSPTEPEELDTVQRHRLWRITIYSHEASTSPSASRNRVLLESYAPTLEAGRELCLQHALTGDTSQMQAIQSAMNAQAGWYVTTDMKAVIALAGLARRPLQWEPEEKQGFVPLQFSADGILGRYQVRWDEERRWVVTFTPLPVSGSTNGSILLQEICFITRTVARAACAVHDQTGQWVAELMENFLPS